ncbi:hypothetical protein JTE90_019829 [Oedothorax gibbosus]|uniref:Uncharacterized protein n=1 Tax=Oedothorax gibbosus TaxID=931172 RepID=A0AAV6V596_9ARAC|nr:hypothetical protein JTE90_019829 [Oedothorax gibbosus]
MLCPHPWVKVISSEKGGAATLPRHQQSAIFSIIAQLTRCSIPGRLRPNINRLGVVFVRSPPHPVQTSRQQRPRPRWSPIAAHEEKGAEIGREATADGFLQRTARATQTGIQREQIPHGKEEAGASQITQPKRKPSENLVPKQTRQTEEELRPAQPPSPPTDGPRSLQPLNHPHSRRRRRRRKTKVIVIELNPQKRLVYI